MHTFEVVRQSHGWAVRLGPGMSVPFRTRPMAIREAERLCASLRRHGVTASVGIEPESPSFKSDQDALPTAAWPDLQAPPAG
jgi:hypothetical protein